MIDPNAPKKKRADGTEDPSPTQPQDPTQPPPAQAMGRAPSPTNFTNFARRFSANKDVSRQQANKYAGQAAGKAGAAAQSLATAQGQFAQGVNTGSVAPPPGSTAPSATNVGAAVPPANSAPVPGATQFNPANPMLGNPATSGNRQPNQLQDMLNQAGKSYSGPEGLDTTQATKDTDAAQQNLDALKDSSGVQALVNDSGQSGTTGADRLSGALIGQAGRKDFDALRAKFNPNKELHDAQDAAVKQAADAKASSEANASAWGERANAEQARQANATQATPDAQKQRNPALDKVPAQGAESNIMAGLENDPEAQKQRGAEFDAFKKATQSDAGDSARDVVNATSPSQWIAEATGNRNPLGDYFTSSYHPNEGNASGSTHGDHIDWGGALTTPAESFWVYRQMDPAQWKEINSLPHNRQKEWIGKRLQQIQAKQAGKPVPSGSGWPQSGGA